MTDQQVCYPASFQSLARLSLAVRNLCRRPGTFHHMMCAAEIFFYITPSAVMPPFCRNRHKGVKTGHVHAKDYNLVNLR